MRGGVESGIVSPVTYSQALPMSSVSTFKHCVLVFSEDGKLYTFSVSFC